MSDPKHCIVRNCINGIKGQIIPGTQFVCIPNSEERRREWLQNLQRHDLIRYLREVKSLGKLYVCSQHFADDAWTARGKIKHRVAPLQLPKEQFVFADINPPCAPQDQASTSVSVNQPIIVREINQNPVRINKHFGPIEVTEVKIISPQISDKIIVHSAPPKTAQEQFRGLDYDIVINPQTSEKDQIALLKTELKRVHEQYEDLFSKYEEYKIENKKRAEEEASQIAEYMKQVVEKDNQIAEKDNLIVQINNQIAEKDNQLTEINKQLNFKEKLQARDAKTIEKVRETCQILMQQLKEARQINDEKNRNIRKYFLEMMKKDFDGDLYVLFENLIKNDKKKGTARRYTAEIKEWTSKLYSISPLGYHHLKSTFLLPPVDGHSSTRKRRKKQIAQENTSESSEDDDELFPDDEDLLPDIEDDEEL